jgi:hypothetical protein
MPDDESTRPLPNAAEWINQWVDDNLPPDPTDTVAWRYAVGCTETLARTRLAPVLELLRIAVLDYKLTPLDGLLLGNMVVEVTQHIWNRGIAPEKRQYLSQIYSASRDVAEDLVENDFPDDCSD